MLHYDGDLDDLERRFNAAKELMRKQRAFSFTCAYTRTGEAGIQLKGILIINRAAQLTATSSTEQAGEWIITPNRAYRLLDGQWYHTDRGLVAEVTAAILTLRTAPTYIGTRIERWGTAELNGQTQTWIRAVRYETTTYTAWLSERTNYLTRIDDQGQWGTQRTNYTPLNEQPVISVPADAPYRAQPTDREISTDPIVQQAQRYREARRYAEAIAAYTDVLARDPAHLGALIERARCYLALDAIEAALQDLEAARTLWPAHYQQRRRINRDRARHDRIAYHEAAAALEEASAGWTLPDQLAALQLCAAIYRAVEAEPQRASVVETIVSRGSAAFAAGALEQAHACYEAALLLQPQHGRALFLRGRVHEQLGAQQAALRDLAAAGRSGVHEAHFFRALLLHQAGYSVSARTEVAAYLASDDAAYRAQAKALLAQLH